MDGKCSAREYLEQIRPDKAGADFDYVQIYTLRPGGESRFQCIKANRMDGAGPGAVHLSPDEGLAEIKSMYLPHDGHEYRVKLRYCLTGRPGQIADITIPETISNPRDVVEEPPPAPIITDFADPTEIARMSLSYAAEQGREMTSMAQHRDQHSRDLAHLAVDHSERNADKIVTIVSEMNRASMERADRHAAAMGAMVEQFKELAQISIQGATMQVQAAQDAAAKQVAAADQRAQAAANRASPAGLWMAWGPTLKKGAAFAKDLFEAAGGFDGIKAKVGGMVAGEAGGVMVDGVRGVIGDIKDAMIEINESNAAIKHARESGMLDDLDDDDVIDVADADDE